MKPCTIFSNYGRLKWADGFTVVELLVVIAIMAIFSSLSVWGFSSWKARYGVESATKEIYATLMKARNDASTTNTPYLVTFAAHSVQAGPDADGDGNIDGTPITLDYSTYTVNFALTPISFDRRGLADTGGVDNQTISITSSASGINPAVDCIVVSATRINLGKMTGGACVQQ
ncbi:MAG: GspH/FimT family pseudopilin [Dissulfuribacterales bacterium]